MYALDSSGSSTTPVCGQTRVDTPDVSVTDRPIGTMPPSIVFADHRQMITGAGNARVRRERLPCCGWSDTDYAGRLGDLLISQFLAIDDKGISRACDENQCAGPSTPT
jgi:hypothetical protein